MSSKRITCPAIAATTLVLICVYGCSTSTSPTGDGPATASPPVTAAPTDVVHVSASWALGANSIKGMAVKADAIVLGTVDGVRGASYRDGMAYTDFTVSVDRWLTTKSGTPSHIVVHQMGGTHGGKTYVVEDDPLIKSGDSALLFLREYAKNHYFIMAGPTGRLPLVNGQLRALPGATARDGLPSRVDSLTPRIKRAVAATDGARSKVVN